MNILVKFKSFVTTEDTYPYSLEIIYKLEVTSTDVFKGTYEFIEKHIKGKIVDVTTYCEGILQIRNIKSSEALDLAQQGIHTI